MAYTYICPNHQESTLMSATHPAGEKVSVQVLRLEQYPSGGEVDSGESVNACGQ